MFGLTRITRFLREHDRVLTVVGAIIVVATAVIKDDLQEHAKALVADYQRLESDFRFMRAYSHIMLRLQGPAPGSTVFVDLDSAADPSTVFNDFNGTADPPRRARTLKELSEACSFLSPESEDLVALADADFSLLKKLPPDDDLKRAGKSAQAAAYNSSKRTKDLQEVLKKPPKDIETNMFSAAQRTYRVALDAYQEGNNKVYNFTEQVRWLLGKEQENQRVRSDGFHKLANWLYGVGAILALVGKLTTRSTSETESDDLL